MPNWINSAVADYCKRLPPPWNTHIQEIAPIKRSKNANIASILNIESQRLLQAKPKHAFTIALDRQGKQYSSTAFAQLIDSKLGLGIPINFLIGGPEGLSHDSVTKSDLSISLSAMTFPHPLVRVILVEQIYRAWSIINRHPYHR